MKTRYIISKGSYLVLIILMMLSYFIGYTMGMSTAIKYAVEGAEELLDVELSDRAMSMILSNPEIFELVFTDYDALRSRVKMFYYPDNKLSGIGGSQIGVNHTEDLEVYLDELTILN